MKLFSIGGFPLRRLLALVDIFSGVWIKSRVTNQLVQFDGQPNRPVSIGPGAGEAEQRQGEKLKNWNREKKSSIISSSSRPLATAHLNCITVLDRAITRLDAATD